MASEPLLVLISTQNPSSNPARFHYKPHLPHFPDTDTVKIHVKAKRIQKGTILSVFSHLRMTAWIEYVPISNHNLTALLAQWNLQVSEPRK